MFEGLMDFVSNVAATVECEATCIKNNVANDFARMGRDSSSTKVVEKKIEIDNLNIETLNINVDEDGNFTGQDGKKYSIVGLIDPSKIIAPETEGVNQYGVPNKVAAALDVQYATTMQNPVYNNVWAFYALLADMNIDETNPANASLPFMKEVINKIMNVEKVVNMAGLNPSEIRYNAYQQVKPDLAERFRPVQYAFTFEQEGSMSSAPIVDATPATAAV